MTLAVIFLTVYAVLVTWVCIIQFKRCNKLRDVANTVVSNMVKISDIIRKGRDTLNNSTLVTAFSNDDETGTFFEGMKEIQNLLNNFILTDGQES